MATVEVMLYPSTFDVLRVLPMDTEDEIHYGLELELNFATEDARYRSLMRAIQCSVTLESSNVRCQSLRASRS
jgi:hypothetical protein